VEQTSTTTSPASGVRIHPPLVALLCLVGALALHMIMPGAQTVFAHHLLGLIVVAVGIGVCFYAAAIFQARDTTKNPYGEPTSFVTTMPYTFTRNPMYLGVTIALLGFAIFFAAPEMLLAPVAFFVIIDRMVIPREEQTMERLFGTPYLDYKARVRRWL
jgi:protein-S-isoprenylcysteine O-methyltransferase Ste14